MLVYVVRGDSHSGEDCLAIVSSPAKAEAFIDRWLKEHGGPDGDYGPHTRDDMDYYPVVVDGDRA